MKKHTLSCKNKDLVPQKESKTLTSDEQFLQELGQLFDLYRRSQRIPDKQIFENSGVSKQALAKFKKGHNISLLNFIKILRGADLLPSLKQMVKPLESFSPMQMALQQSTQVPERIRTRKSKKGSKKKQFQWGDE